MPHVVIHLSGEPDAQLTRKVVDKVNELTQTVLDKKLPVIAITVQYFPAHSWRDESRCGAWPVPSSVVCGGVIVGAAYQTEKPEDMIDVIRFADG